MKSTLISAAWIGLAVYSGAVPLPAQLRDNTEKQMTCENGGSNEDRVRHCEIREQTVPGVGTLTIDGGQNGGTTVKGWLRSDVLVRARVEATGESQTTANMMASQVMIDSTGGRVRATGPEPANDSSWSVSYEIFVPQNSDLSLKANNGGMTISDVRGKIHFDANNGGVHLKRVAGDVSGATVNGGIQVELTGSTWDGNQMEVSTHNGGITVAMPANYSAHLQAETGAGRIQSEFPVTMQGEVKPRRLDFSVGAGGPLIHIKTTNGGINVKRAESE